MSFAKNRVMPAGLLFTFVLILFSSSIFGQTVQRQNIKTSKEPLETRLVKPSYPDTFETVNNSAANLPVSQQIQAIDSTAFFYKQSLPTNSSKVDTTLRASKIQNIRKLYLFPHNIYNELILNKKRLNTT